MRSALKKYRAGDIVIKEHDSKIQPVVGNAIQFGGLQVESISVKFAAKI